MFDIIMAINMRGNKGTKVVFNNIYITICIYRQKKGCIEMHLINMQEVIIVKSVVGLIII